MKPKNEISRSSTKYRCRECNSPIFYIQGSSSCTEACCNFIISYYWCDECEDEYDIGELTIMGS